MNNYKKNSDKTSYFDHIMLSNGNLLEKLFSLKLNLYICDVNLIYLIEINVSFPVRLGLVQKKIPVIVV